MLLARQPCRITTLGLAPEHNEKFLTFTFTLFTITGEQTSSTLISPNIFCSWTMQYNPIHLQGFSFSGLS